jgi:hypothetical protein
MGRSVVGKRVSRRGGNDDMYMGIDAEPVRSGDF